MDLSYRMSGGNTITGPRVTMPLSAKVRGGGILFAHNLDNASGTKWCSSLPGTWNKSKSLPCTFSFHRKTLSMKVTLIYVRFMWSVVRMKYLLSNRSLNSFIPTLSLQTNSTEIQLEIYWRIERLGLVHSSQCSCCRRYHSQMHPSKVLELRCHPRSIAWQWDTAIRQKWNASILSSVQFNFFEPLYFVNQLFKGLNHLCRLRDIITKMFSQFPVEGSLRLLDASSEVKEVPVLEIRCPTYSTSSSPNSVFHGAAPILCEYCPDTHHS